MGPLLFSVEDVGVLLPTTGRPPQRLISIDKLSPSSPSRRLVVLLSIPINVGHPSPSSSSSSSAAAMNLELTFYDHPWKVYVRYSECIERVDENLISHCTN
jgi:hypothetical protein